MTDAVPPLTRARDLLDQAPPAPRSAWGTLLAALMTACAAAALAGVMILAPTLA